MEQEELTGLVQIIKTAGRDNDEYAAAILKLAADSIALEAIKGLPSAVATPFPDTGKKRKNYRKKKRSAS